MMTDQTQSYSEEEARKVFESRWYAEHYEQMNWIGKEQCWNLVVPCIASQAEQIRKLESQRDSALVRIREFDACIQQVATALGGVCCGGVDVDQNDPHSTTSVLVDAIHKLQNERDNARDMLEVLEQTPERIKDKEFQHRAFQILEQDDRKQHQLAQAITTIAALEAKIDEADEQEPVLHTTKSELRSPFGSLPLVRWPNEIHVNESKFDVPLYTKPPITSERELALLAVIEQMREELRYVDEVSCGDCELVDVQDDTEAMAYINEHISQFLDALTPDLSALKHRQPYPNHNWCVGCSPDNCAGCGTEPEERRKA